MKLINKYLTGTGELGILRLDNTYVQKPTIVEPMDYDFTELIKLKTTDPILYDFKMLELALKAHPTSEIIRYVDHTGTLRRVTTNAGSLSGNDPIGETFVIGAVLNPAFKWLGDKILWGLGKLGNNWAKAKLISKEMNPIKPAISTVKPLMTLVQKPEVVVSSPYIRLNPTMNYANEAVSIYSKDLPWNFFLLIKDNKTSGLKVNPNGEYSVHFKTNRNAFRPEEKLEMFDVLESQIPEGAKVSTWGNLTKGGYSGLNRFGNLYGYTRVGTRLKDIPVYLKNKIFLNIIDHPEELGNPKFTNFVILRKGVAQGLEDSRNFVLSDAVLKSREFNLKIADRLHMLRLPAYEYKLKPVIYHNKFEKKNWNFKGLSPEKVGGYYDHTNKTVNLKSNYYSATAARPIAFHENLHAQGYGPSEVNKWKIQFLLDPKKISKMPPEAKAYYFSPEEFPVHTATLGETWGVKPGLLYPGDKAFDQLIIDKGISGSPFYMKRDTPKDKRRFWRTLNGTMFSLPLIGIINKKGEP